MVSLSVSIFLKPPHLITKRSLSCLSVFQCDAARVVAWDRMPARRGFCREVGSIVMDGFFTMLAFSNRIGHRFLAKTTLLLASLVLGIFVTGTTMAGNSESHDGHGPAVQGHDPVAYFFDEEALAVDADLTAEWQGVTYRFATDFNRQAFAADPSAWAFSGHRLFLFKNAKVREIWLRDPDGNIAKGEAAWPSAS